MTLSLQNTEIFNILSEISVPTNDLEGIKQLEDRLIFFNFIISVLRKPKSKMMTKLYILQLMSENKKSHTQLNPLSANPIKWSNTLKQFVGNSRRIV